MHVFYVLMLYVIMSLRLLIHVHAVSNNFLHANYLDQNSAFPGVRGKGITSRMFTIPVTYCTIRSRPKPKPA
jgi:hypothetical protein